MIEFNGYITGDAERFFKKKILMLCLLIVSMATVLFIPITFLLEKYLPIKGLAIIINLATPIIFGGASFLIVSKRFIKEIKPKKVFINDMIVGVEIGNETESRMIEEIENVHDYGDFYVLYFSKGKAFHYICQKNTLSKGSLEEFEALFDGRIIRVV